MKKNLPLTDKEEKILAFIYGYIDNNKYSPTRMEISTKFKMSTRGSDYFVNQLIKKGKLKITDSKWRNIKIK